ncbi:DUF4232 domain-containing protein [Streptomyces dysideae]|uniref:DUF4232 domain-containing protein n=1 Tax=Streptomyces dysideae TaxID=909626 RepID=A0A101UV78_9ACTN|nr:DUF4232 domain-containing protein [Streptomyces dysideae]KUO17430.1 hypothetical protein AQJ91_30325 [Streptomyces dysideae]
MRSSPFTLPSVVAGVLLLAACGTQQAGSQSDGPAPTGVSGSPSGPVETCGEPESGVRLIRLAGAVGADCTGFEVTNDGTEPFTYTITLSLLSDSGGVMDNAQQVVSSVKPGQTVKRKVFMGATTTWTGLAIAKVRSVPTDEASAERGPCPASGVRVYADQGSAAMGLRVVGLRLENCGTRTYQLNGYPRLQPLDESHKPVDGVSVLRGGSSIATGTGADDTPQPLALAPGERARAGLVWRNTTEAGVGDPVNAPYVRVWAKPGAAPVTVIPELDLGTTGKLAVGAWKKDER